MRSGLRVSVPPCLRASAPLCAKLFPSSDHADASSDFDIARIRSQRREIRLDILWPLGWLAETLVVGGLSGWYPYPFLDHREPDGTTGVVVSSLGITVFFLLLFWLARTFDQRAKVAP